MSANQGSNWISLSDMMTGLMLVFLLISILSISHVAKQEEKRKELLVEFDNAKTEIFDELKETFNDKEAEWGIETSADLSIKFENPDVLFERLSDEITPEFKLILDEFIPLYIDIIGNPKYADKIKEVRVEGHTATWPDYMYTVELSQKRANAVLKYILNSKTFNDLEELEQKQLKFWLTANGLGNGRMVDSEGELIFYSGNDADIQSRRVEFKIVTTSDELVDKIINNSLN